jgi:hypothetical protein
MWKKFNSIKTPHLAAFLLLFTTTHFLFREPKAREDLQLDTLPLKNL